FFLSYPTTIVLLSRFSRLVFPSLKNRSCAAMCVQPRALVGRAIQYIVLYCLTPPPIHRYSWLNLCPPFPAWDGRELSAHLFWSGGIRLVNSSQCSIAGNRPLKNGHCFFQGVQVA